MRAFLLSALLTIGGPVAWAQPFPATTSATPLAVTPDVPVDSVEADAPYNRMILDVIGRMPHGGGFSVKRTAIVNLNAAVKLEPGASSPVMDLAPATAEPSFCSEATYLVFLGLVQDLMAQKKLQLSPADAKALLVKGQADGEGIWGRWNANGPGTARLFHELGLGTNFQSLASARPGDFVKLFWNDQIGVKEFGHSVIYLGTRATPAGEVIHIWSSNIHVGYGDKEVPVLKIKRMLFSRVTNPSALENISRLPKQDSYLASMLTRSSTEEEMSAMVGLPEKKESAPSQTAPNQ